MNKTSNMELISIHRYENNILSEFNDNLGIETELEINNNGETFKLSCTGIHLEELKEGFLFSNSNINKESIPNHIPIEIEYESILSAFKDFSTASPLFRETGSVHSGQLLDKDFNILFFTEDMGRHNVIDKIIGFSLINNIPLNESTLMISSRMPLELITKSCKAGILRIASISAPTKNAVLYARKNNISLVGMYRNNRFNVYSK